MSNFDSTELEAERSSKGSFWQIDIDSICTLRWKEINVDGQAVCNVGRAQLLTRSVDVNRVVESRGGLADCPAVSFRGGPLSLPNTRLNMRWE